MIRQVDYREELNCLVSAAECREIPVGQTAYPGLVLTDLGVQRKETIMRMTRVIFGCINYSESNNKKMTKSIGCILLRLRPN